MPVFNSHKYYLKLKQFRVFHVLALSFGLLSASYSISKQKENTISYQEAAKYTHMLWQHPKIQPININLLSIKNYSGIPIEKRSENAEYYNHGKIPYEIDILTSSLIQSTRQFTLNNSQLGDYQLQFSIDRYQLPHKYAPDDNIWDELKDEVDRWALKEKSSLVSLSLKISSANKPISPWSKTITSRLTSCDVNISPQALLHFASSNQTLEEYLQSAPAQAFIASSNYLIIEALKFLRTKNQLAVISKMNGNEFLIKSDGASFNPGDLLPVYQVNNQQTSSLPLGLVEVVKTYGNQAVAYPINFKYAHAKVGDQVEMNIASGFEEPDYLLDTKNRCGNTQVFEVAAR